MTNNLKIWTRKIKAGKNLTCSLFGGIISLALGILLIIWPLNELALTERLRMRPGLPAFDWWVAPSKSASLDIYIYNVTNAERFLNGDDPKLLLEEIGPIVFKEVWNHQNVVFNDNGTISYMANRTITYNEEDNTIDLNSTIVVPNMAVLLAVSYLWDISAFAKFGLNSFLDVLNSKPIVTTTVYQYLYNNTDPFLDMAHNFFPGMAPVRNMGIIYLLYRDFCDQVTAFVGPERGHQLFSLIDKYHGSTNIPYYDDSCKIKITNATEAVMCNQKVTRETVVRYYRKHLCRVIPLYFEREERLFGVTAYRFGMLKNELDRISPLEDDCFDTYPSLPDGFSDISKCFFSFPMVVTFVYFNYTDVGSKSCGEILRPNGQFVELPHMYVEPTTGLILSSSAPLQVNLNIRPLRGFNNMFDRFSDKMVPVLWVRYHNDDLPLKVQYLMHFFLFLPAVGWILIAVFSVVGVYCLWKSVRRKHERKEIKNLPVVELHRSASLELDAFIKNSHS